MNKIIDDARKYFMIVTSVTLIISLLLTFIFSYIADEPFVAAVITWVFAVVIIGACAISFSRFRKTIDVQQDRFGVSGFEFDDYHVESPYKNIYMTSEWFLAPRSGIAVSKPFFDSVVASEYRVKGVKRYQVVIRDIDGKTHAMEVPGKVQHELIERINTWAYGEQYVSEVVTHDDIKPNNSNKAAMIVGILVTTIICIVALIIAFSNDTGIYEIDEIKSDIKEKEIIEELREKSLFPEQYDLFAEYLSYRTYGPYEEEYTVYIDNIEGNTYSLIIDNTSNYLMCGYIELATDEDMNDVRHEENFGCIRPYDYYYNEFTSTDEALYYYFDEFNHISLYYQSSWHDERSYDYDEDGYWYNLAVEELDYNEAISIARYMYGESVLVNEEYATIYIYDNKLAQKYRLDSGYNNFKTISASYAAIIDVTAKAIDMYKVNGEEVVYIESISMESLY
ncbi:MAG: hypothetical protein IKM20_00835 [Erysipelotrichales bacterium]|nr:hypothetical protein [Erysipelotrichales bacterium]